MPIAMMTRTEKALRLTALARCCFAIITFAASALTGTFWILRAGQSEGAKAPGKGAAAIRRLQPSDVVALPAEFVEKLNARGCTIPQFDSGADAGDAAASAEPTNVIHGEFARKGQQDWAVLCSNGKTSTIVIYWGKATACPASLARLDDAHYLKPGENKALHYSRSIRALGESELDDRAGLAGLKPLSHQGIDDRFVSKSSAFFYCNEGKWRIFPAKDSAPKAAD